MQRVIWNNMLKFGIGLQIVENQLIRNVDIILNNLINEFDKYFPAQEMKLYDAISIILDPKHMSVYNETKDLINYGKDELKLILQHFGVTKLGYANQRLSPIVDRNQVIVEYNILKLLLFDIKDKYSNFNTTDRVLLSWNDLQTVTKNECQEIFKLFKILSVLQTHSVTNERVHSYRKWLMDDKRQSINHENIDSSLRLIFNSNVKKQFYNDTANLFLQSKRREFITS